jgi:hypothetical protein
MVQRDLIVFKKAAFLRKYIVGGKKVREKLFSNIRCKDRI